MERKNNTDEFAECLILLNRKIELLGKINLNDLAIHAENFYANLFNRLFNLELENANIIKHNFKAIDLLDNKHKVIIQVSANCTKKKVNDTLESSTLKEFSEKNYKLEFVFIGKQNNRIKSYKYSNLSNIKFAPQNDIFLTNDLVECFRSLQLSVQKNIIEYLETEFPKLDYVEKSQKKSEICLEISELLDRNFLIWDGLGPQSETAILNPLAGETKKFWDESKMEIFANNESVIALFTSYKDLFTHEERNIFSLFEEHTKSFRRNHKERIDRSAYRSFPNEFKEMINENIKEGS